jgi:predicted permease
MARELSAHLILLEDEFRRRGMPSEDARIAARRALGGMEQIKEAHRDERSLLWLEHLRRDLRHGVRMTRRDPTFTTIVALTLALGIGANTAVFSIVYSVLFKPLPYHDPDQLFMASFVIPERDATGRLALDIRDVVEWRDARTVFSDVTSLTPAQWNLVGSDEPERVGGAVVSPNFFSFLGVPLAQGRGFAPDEQEPARDRVVVISDELWRRRFAADPAIVGGTISLDGVPHVVVGIAPPSLLVPTGRLMYLPFAPQVDVWKPLVPREFEAQGYNYSHAVLVRLAQGESEDRGRQQLEAMLNAPGKLPADRQPWRVVLTPIRDLYAGSIRLRLLLVLGASSLLLLIACANLAHLILARAASRSNEFATRLALGAAPARIVGQTLVESMMIVAAGGAIGTLIAHAGVRILHQYGTGDLGPLAETRLNLPALALALAITLFTGAACGLLSAWRACRHDLSVASQIRIRVPLGAGGPFRGRQVLVGAEMTLVTALLASALLLLHSFVNVLGADRGYYVEQMLTVDLALWGPRYSTPPQRNAFFRDLLARIGSLPGVLAAGAISEAPVTGNDAASQTIFLGTDTDSQSVMLQRPVAGFRIVTPGYFAASGTVLRAGRVFADQDPGATAVVSEALANRLWPGAQLSDVPGRTIRQGSARPEQALLLTIIGVVGDVRPGAVDQELLPQLYRPHVGPRADGRMSVVVRIAEDPARLAGLVRAEIRKMEPNLPVPAVRTMQETLYAAVAERRFQLVLTGLFALVALLLGAVGVYGAVSYTVISRTRDIGLRMALGATGREVMRWVFSLGLRPVVVGLLLGLGAAVGLARLFQSVLFGVVPADPLSIGVVSLILLLTSCVACYFPARRAVRLDPVAALRHE